MQGVDVSTMRRGDWVGNVGVAILDMGDAHGCVAIFLGKIPILYIYMCVCYSNLMDDGENHDQSWDGMRFQGLRQRHQHRLRLKATLLGWLKGSKQHAICIYDYTSCMMFYTCTRHRAYLYTVYNINTGYIYIINHHHYTDTTIYQHKWHTPFMSYIF